MQTLGEKGLDVVIKALSRLNITTYYYESYYYELSANTYLYL